MNHRLSCLASSFSLLLVPALAAPPQETAAQWAEKNRAALAAITDASLAATLDQGAPAWEKLFTGIKTAGTSDPVASVKIAALSQYVMRPEGARARQAYTGALLAAAQRAAEPDVACFFLQQLRWCGLPGQAEAIRAFEKSSQQGVAALAAMTVQAVTGDRASKALPVKDTPASALNKELAALAPAALTPRLRELAAAPDPVLAGVALGWARTAGGPAETKLWSSQLAATRDPARRTMLLDMLGERRDKAAAEAVAACLADPDDAVAGAAQRALLALDQAAFAARIPALLQDLPPARQTWARDGIRQLPTKFLTSPLTKSYARFSETGKKVALELFKDRRMAEAVPLGLAAIDSPDPDAAIAGWRMLRDLAGPEHAATLLPKLLAATGRVVAEAQATFAAAARRDASGAYTSALRQTLQTAGANQQPLALDAASRIGGADLLQAVDAVSASPDSARATAAVRALADWSDGSSLPLLLRISATATDARQQILAQRGLAKKLGTSGADRKGAEAAWLDLKPKVADEARRKAIDDLFKPNPAR